MSKAVKTIIGVAAAVAIPFAAPAIASSIGLSAAIGATAGSALVGAGLGAASSAVTGGNIGRGALMGGIGGGIGGYTSAPATAGSTAGSAASAGELGTGVTLGSGGQTGLTLGATGQTGLTMPTSFGGTAGQIAGAGVSGGVAAEGLSSGFQAPTTAGELAGGLQPTTGAYQAPMGAGELGTGLQMPAGAGAGLQMPTQAATAATGAAPQTFAQALSKVPGQIAAKFTDPKALADMTLRAAGQLAGSALAGSGLSAEEQALLNAQTEELRTLQQTNADLFRQRLSQAQGLIGESRYFDPEYFGLQSARRAQIAGARAQRAGLRGLEGERRAAEARRFELATGRDVGTAYDVGFGTGVQGRLQTMQTGIGLMPSGYPSSMGDYSNLQRAYGGAAERQQQRQQQIGSLFGSLTGEQKAKKKGEEAV